MQREIKIEYMSGDSAVVTAYPPDFARWEKATGKASNEISGLWDILFIAYSAHKRELAGKPVKAFEQWMDTIADVSVGDDDPKVIQEEALAD